MKPVFDNKLITDEEGNVTKCPKNIYILGFWKSYFKLFSIKECFNKVGFEEIIDSIKDILAIVAWLLFLPIIPLLSAFYQWRKAKRAVENEYSFKGE